MRRDAGQEEQAFLPGTDELAAGAGDDHREDQSDAAVAQRQASHIGTPLEWFSAGMVSPNLKIARENFIAALEKAILAAHAVQKLNGMHDAAALEEHSTQESS
ncbi:hypothetical protein CYMTET_41364 [Cymbomonas tetramitiformis]|uniref:Uncharacterized protein n=1 Tax=Cymbomonas tetramitiformis TaxID=36881 RepID=A0AAE0C6A5_9CHLO|nr:hypothetical protein CYMTET_41364 [Cymbomonas tetramitiformis]